MKNERKETEEKVVIFDTTLRDGEQSPGASLNSEEKFKVAKQLECLGVDVIEAGFPISSRDDFQAVKFIAENIKGPIICALARTKDIDIDRAGEALKPAKKRRIHTFIATSDVHLEKKLKISKEEAIEMAIVAVKRARNFTDDVEFSPEDAGRTDLNYMCQIIEAAIDTGSTTVNIPDTVGYSNPEEFGARIRYITEHVPNIKKAVISVHCHNDLGLAVANSLAGVLNGARQVECTINGLGERAGNASLEEVVMNLVTRKDYYDFYTDIKTGLLYPTSKLVSGLTGIPVQVNKAIVGNNAFAHEAGIHQHGVLQERGTYEIMNPSDVGWVGTSMVMGKHSGKHALKERLIELGYTVNEEKLTHLIKVFKRLADRQKYVYDDDLIRIMEQEYQEFREFYSLEELCASSGTKRMSNANIKLRKAQKVFTSEAVGNGPVDAALQAIKKLTGIEAELIGYSINAIGLGTDARGEVSVTLKNNGQIANGRGADTDVVVASAKAYVAAINRLLQF